MLKLLCSFMPGLVLLAGCASAPASLDETVALTALAPASVGPEPLRLRLMAVNDERCAADVRCVWAGHATVTLQVQRGSAAPELILLGTPSPAGMRLPGEGRAGPYALQLVRLEPPNHSKAKPALLQYRVVIRVRTIPAS